MVLTAAQDDARRAGEVGADAYVAKPFAIDELIRCWIGASRRARARALCRTARAIEIRAPGRGS